MTIMYKIDFKKQNQNFFVWFISLSLSKIIIKFSLTTLK